MSDSFDFKLVDVPMEHCLAVAFSHNDKAVGWREVKFNGVSTLVLYSFKDDGMIPFPSPLSAIEVRPLLEGWLKRAEYGPEPDHDGDNQEGFIAFSPSYHSRAAFLGIQPTWIMYGK